jgi:hypothetical protein
MSHGIFDKIVRSRTSRSGRESAWPSESGTVSSARMRFAEPRHNVTSARKNLEAWYRSGQRRGRVLAASWNDESTQETEFNGLSRPRPIIVADDGGTVGSEVVEPKRGDYAQSSKVISYVISKNAGTTLLVKEEYQLQVQSQTEPEKLPA